MELSFLQILGPEIFLPAEVDVQLLSADNAQVNTAKVQMPTEVYEAPFVVQPYKAEFTSAQKARYIHIQAKRTPRMGWLFLDEIVVK